jgi:MFS family permease
VKMPPLERFVYRGNRPFTWLLWSQTISLFGSQVSLVAIPLLAALSLGAEAFEMGLLVAVEMGAYLLISVPAGVLADRVDRRRLLIASNLGRAGFLLAIPAGAALGSLSLPLLYAVACSARCSTSPIRATCPSCWRRAICSTETSGSSCLSRRPGRPDRASPAA